MNTPIDIKKRNYDKVEVFEFIGELDETNADKTFTAIYNAIGDFTGKILVFNFSGLKYLNSKSIGYIADIFSNIEDGNGQMFLTNMTDEVRDTLELVGITTIIETFNTEQEVLVKFNINIPAPQ
ncbi:MAG: STAS domain-containing protein [Candidatus Gracilibacteria bacterium]|nr:STAS domain-containing protein [Candidatus Gracilibacteria bacterium]MDD2908470.1 STAS domain-containing protein [Candidatus Gracilibacteria bacterium]